MLKVYYLHISAIHLCAEADWLTWLSEETRKVIQHYRNMQVRKTKVAGEAMVRQLLKSLFGLEGSDYRMDKNEHGKPLLKDLTFPVYYNLSHSGEYIVCAIADSEVGVDIERKGKARLEVARRFFHPREIQKLETLPPSEQADLFFRYWSVKESYLKYKGTGLAASLSGFEVQFERERIGIVKNRLPEPIYIRECLIDEGYKCFVCSATAELPEVLPYPVERMCQSFTE